MKRVLFIAGLLLAVFPLSSSAQGGAGLSQGQAVAPITPTPTRQKKVCSECGITMGNITYAWQHETWCPYYRSQSSGSSGSAHSYSQSTEAVVAGAVMGALGQALASSIISGPSVSISEFYGAKTYSNRTKGKENGGYVVVYDERADAKGIYSNASKKWLIKPYSYDDFWLWDMYAVAAQKRKNKKWGAINPFTKKVLVPFEFGTTLGFQSDISPRIYFYGPEANGRCKVLFPRKGGGYSLSDETYEDAQVSWKGSGMFVSLKKNGKWSLWGRYGDKYIESEWEKIIPLHNAGGKSACFVMMNGKWGLLIDGNITLPTEFENIWQFNASTSHFAAVRSGGKTGIYLADGTRLLPEEFESKVNMVKSGDRQYFLLSSDGKFCAYDTDGVLAVPLLCSSEEMVKDWLETSDANSYSQYVKARAQALIANKGEFEKTSDFEARRKDPELMSRYVNEHLGDTEQAFIDERLAAFDRKNDAKNSLSISDYDADKESFILTTPATPWHSTYYLPVPVAKAPLFKAEFNSVKTSAVASAHYCVRDDSLMMDYIEFRLSDGTVISCKY